MSKKPLRPKPSAKARALVPGFAAMIRRERESLGWTRSELARRARVGSMTVSNLENEQRGPSLRIAMQIAMALNLKNPLANPTSTQV